MYSVVKREQTECLLSPIHTERVSARRRASTRVDACRRASTRQTKLMLKIVSIHTCRVDAC